MTIYKTLRALISKTTTRRPKTTRSFLTASNPPPLTQHHPPLNYPFALPSKWVIFFPPFHGGPLFLSSPPWKLSQSATPLLHRNGVVLRRLNLEDFGLIKGRRKRKEKEAGRGEGGGVRSVQARSGLVEEVQEKEGIIRSFVNLPNLISMARLVSGPFIGWMITHEMYTEAFVGLAISGATDWLDGYVARKMRINSVVGSYLDPLADKVLIGSVALAMMHMDLLHPGLVGLVVLRDVALIGGAVYHRARSLGWKWSSWYDFVNLDGTRPEKVEPLFISKVNTVFQLLLVAAALLQPEFGSPETQSCITYLSWLVASTTVASTASYGAQYMRNRSLLLAKKS